ncbi:hypothetical protein ACFL21_05035 [Patescibacteria group bacterium]
MTKRDKWTMAGTHTGTAAIFSLLAALIWGGEDPNVLKVEDVKSELTADLPTTEDMTKTLTGCKDAAEAEGQARGETEGIEALQGLLKDEEAKVTACEQREEKLETQLEGAKDGSGDWKTKHDTAEEARKTCVADKDALNKRLKEAIGKDEVDEDASTGSDDGPSDPTSDRSTLTSCPSFSDNVMLEFYYSYDGDTLLRGAQCPNCKCELQKTDSWEYDNPSYMVDGDGPFLCEGVERKDSDSLNWEHQCKRVTSSP